MKNRFIKVIVFIIGTILLGAIGTGLWEVFLKGFCNNLMELSINGLNFIIRTYKDSIYAEVANGFHEKSSVAIHVFVLSIMPILYLFMLMLHKKAMKLRNKDVKESHSKFREFILSKKGYYILLLMTVSLFISFTFSAIKIKYTNSVITYSKRCIFILKPYLSIEKYNNILSQLHRINNSQDFYKFNDTLKNIADQNNLELPKFKAL